MCSRQMELDFMVIPLACMIRACKCNNHEPLLPSLDDQCMQMDAGKLVSRSPGDEGCKS